MTNKQNSPIIPEKLLPTVSTNEDKDWQPHRYQRLKPLAMAIMKTH
ncbi:hypothetical protein [Flavobacterium sp.]|nr:hypothetical protein [Flavobacterium sp.]HSD06601.1 hypothetical protein [Flavobacterium sp.]